MQIPKYKFIMHDYGETKSMKLLPFSTP